MPSAPSWVRCEGRGLGSGWLVPSRKCSPAPACPQGEPRLWTNLLTPPSPRNVPWALLESTPGHLVLPERPQILVRSRKGINLHEVELPFAPPVVHAQGWTHKACWIGPRPPRSWAVPARPGRQWGNALPTGPKPWARTVASGEAREAVGKG